MHLIGETVSVIGLLLIVILMQMVVSLMMVSTKFACLQVSITLTVTFA